MGRAHRHQIDEADRVPPRGEDDFCSLREAALCERTSTTQGKSLRSHRRHVMLTCITKTNVLQMEDYDLTLTTRIFSFASLTLRADQKSRFSLIPGSLCRLGCFIAASWKWDLMGTGDILWILNLGPGLLSSSEMACHQVCFINIQVQTTHVSCACRKSPGTSSRVRAAAPQDMWWLG